MVKGETKPRETINEIMNKNLLNPKPRGTKTAIPIKKIQKKDSRRVSCSKRREGLYSKTSQFCLLSGAQMAILATPPSSDSYASFYSFGHSSVDGVVSAFLAGTRPVPEDNKEMMTDVGVCLTRKDLGLGFWWEDNESLLKSENPEELKNAIDSMSALLNHLKQLKNNDGYLSANFNEITEEKDQILSNALTEGNLDYNLDQAFVDEKNATQTLNLQSTCSIDDYLPSNFNESNEEKDQIFTNCESFCVTDNNNALTEGSLDYNQETDIEQLIDFDTVLNSSFDDWVCSQQQLEETAASNLTNSELSVDDYVPMETTYRTSLCNGVEVVEDGALDEDDICFADFLNEFITS